MLFWYTLTLNILMKSVTENEIGTIVKVLFLACLMMLVGFIDEGDIKYT